MIAKKLKAEQLDLLETIFNNNEEIRDEQSQAKQNSWPQPIPFDDYALLPDFPVDVLPCVGKRVVTELTTVAQVDPGLPGIVYLAVVSTCLGGKVSVDLKSHKEPCNIFLAAVLPSGKRKSFIVTQMSRPVYDYQHNRQQEMRDIIRKAINRQKVLEARLAKLQKQAANTEDQIERLQFINIAADVDKQIKDEPVPAKPVYVVDDITTEKLGMLMAENGERMAILSPEGGIFKLMNGFYNERDGNFDLYLKSHAGDPWSSHRVGRESTSMLNPSLTMGLAIQPDVLEEIGQNRHFHGRGLLARFLFSICQSKAGYRSRQTNAVPEALLREYSNHIYSLMDLPSNVVLVLTQEAHTVWN